MRRRKIKKILIWSLLILFVLMNVMAYLHAYKLTHFSDEPSQRTTAEMGTLEKLKVVFTGVSNPRPANKKVPSKPHETHKVQSNVLLDCWLIKADSALGTVILFHGYAGEKSSMLDKADEFLALGYNTMLVDFMGSGASEGNATTIGFEEAQEVYDVYQYLNAKGFSNISLFGTSMGAVAIMKAMKDHPIKPASLILECPFGSMYKTVRSRFRMNDLPSFPMAGLLVFWGGMQHSYWAFSHKPEEYASYINCPVLLLYGEKDERVSRDETDTIFNNLRGEKKLGLFPLAGHENYLLQYRDQWVNLVKEFLSLHR